MDSVACWRLLILYVRHLFHDSDTCSVTGDEKRSAHADTKMDGTFIMRTILKIQIVT